MDATHVFRHVRTELAKIRAEQAEFVASGRVADFAEYRHVCGVLRGLDRANELVTDLAKKMELSDDD
jgi:hypothetical protein